MWRKIFWGLVAGLALTVPGTGSADSILLADPAPYLVPGPDAMWASHVMALNLVEPNGDWWADGSAALFSPDDIGFHSEPDSHLNAGLGTGGMIELAFENSIINNGLLASDDGMASAEILIFEDALLDGASFYGRMLKGGRLLPLGSVSDVVSLNPTASGYGYDGLDTVIAIDLDTIFDVNVNLGAIRIVDDGLSQDTDTFEVDAVLNRSMGVPMDFGETSVPEASLIGLLATLVIAAALHRTRRRG